MSSQAYCVVGRSPRLAFWSVIKNHFHMGWIVFWVCVCIVCFGLHPPTKWQFSKISWVDKISYTLWHVDIFDSGVEKQFCICWVVESGQAKCWVFLEGWGCHDRWPGSADHHQESGRQWDWFILVASVGDSGTIILGYSSRLMWGNTIYLWIIQKSRGLQWIEK